jgi:glycosyltransferase involved in cell wall biosynthesis
MYRGRKIGLVIPAYKEERLIAKTLAAVPELIDRVYVVDDHSPDGQAAVVQACALVDKRVTLLRHDVNLGPGAAIITGYRQSAKDRNDITVVVGGDHQMDLAEVSVFLDPLVDGKADYAKGNRFLPLMFDDTVKRMPRIRLVGNWIITVLTKIASGYFKTMDVVDGYTAATLKVLETIDWSAAWQGYGYPMDFLVRLNGYGFRVIDVPRTAIYTPGERQSQIKGLRYALRVSPMLVRDFFWRMSFKYMYRDFHPLVFFYLTGLALVPLGLSLGSYLVWNKVFSDGLGVSGPRAILVALTLISGFQFLLFAMLFDMQESEGR